MCVLCYTEYFAHQLKALGSSPAIVSWYRLNSAYVMETYICTKNLNVEKMRHKFVDKKKKHMGINEGTLVVGLWDSGDLE